MTELAEMFRREVDGKCLERRRGKCEKDGCGLLIESKRVPQLIIDFDKQGSPLPEGRPRCDYLFVAGRAGNKGWIVPLELKSGRYKAGEVVKQLEAGARFAETIVSENIKARFLPVLVFGRSPNKAERTKLKSIGKVSFHGKAEAVRLIKCGGRLKLA